MVDVWWWSIGVGGKCDYCKPQPSNWCPSVPVPVGSKLQVLHGARELAAQAGALRMSQRSRREVMNLPLTAARVKQVIAFLREGITPSRHRCQRLVRVVCRWCLVLPGPNTPWEGAGNMEGLGTRSSDTWYPNARISCKIFALF